MEPTFTLIAPCPKRPDIDCIAGAVAYTEFCQATQNITAAPWLCGIPDGAAQFFLDAFPTVRWATDAEAAQATSYALIDFSTPLPLPPTVDLNKVTIVIDHRFLHSPQHDFPNAVIQLEAVGAAATLVAEKFIAAGIKPSHAASAMLIGAIHSNTLNFKSPLTTNRDHAAFAWLATMVPETHQLIEDYQRAHRAAALSDLPQTLRDDTKQCEAANGIPYIFSQIEMTDALHVWNSENAAIKTIIHSMGANTVLNIVDTTAGVSISYTNDNDFRARLSAFYKQEFGNDDALHLNPPQLRKQLAAVLQD